MQMNKFNMGSIYRHRPHNENTLSELSEAYLWFSKPSAFKDVEDSNVQLMISKNEILQRAFSLVLNEYGLNELQQKLKHIGICCFTTQFPSINARKYFPKGKNSICIEYDKEKLANHFLNRIGMPDCFKEVIYSNEPIKIGNDGDYHILMRKDKDGEYYESILGMKFDYKRFFEKLLIFLLTRINERFINQKELRIIWAGFRIIESENLGYHVDIPKDCIKCIYIYPDTPIEFLEAVNILGYDVKTIENQ